MNKTGENTMTNGKSRITSEREFNYAFEKLNKAVDKCDENALEWVMASIRSNEKALYKGEITDSKYNDQQQQVSGLVANFIYNCRCHGKSQPIML